MFYENDDAGYALSSVLRLERPADEVRCGPRAWTAVSMRLSGTSWLDSGGEHFTAGPGSVLFIPSGVPYHRISTDEELVILHLHCMGMEEKKLQVWQPTHDSRTPGLFIEIADVWQRAAPGFRHRCMALWEEALGEMEASVRNADPRERLIQNSVTYMRLHFDDPALRMSDVARQSSISEVYFRRLYRELYGCAPSAALQRMRLERAAQLLQSGYFNVSEAAEKAGFDNVKYFSTLFRQKTGRTPSAFRQENRE